ncbi:MAG: hypothetical protein ACKVZ0_16165 [Gemmatimonadales bacterium]
MERANALIVQQVEGKERSRAANRARRPVRSQLSAGLLGLFGRVFVVASEEVPGLRGVRAPRVRSSDPAFINAAGGMIRAAREHLDALAKYGVTAGLVDDAGKLLAEYEAISIEAKAAFQARVGASRALDVVRAEIMGLIGRIDRLNRHRFASEPEALARWETARNLIGPAVKSTSEAPPSGSGGDVPAAA